MISLVRLISLSQVLSCRWCVHQRVCTQQVAIRIFAGAKHKGSVRAAGDLPAASRTGQPCLQGGDSAVSPKDPSTARRRPMAWGVLALTCQGAPAHDVTQDFLHLLHLLREGASKQIHLFRNCGTSSYLNWS